VNQIRELARPLRSLWFFLVSLLPPLRGGRREKRRLSGGADLS
jgi:hypothetical protein